MGLHSLGFNTAEAHPVGFQRVMEAKRRGARTIHVDPRFTRTSTLFVVSVNGEKIRAVANHGTITE